MAGWTTNGAPLAVGELGAVATKSCVATPAVTVTVAEADVRPEALKVMTTPDAAWPLTPRPAKVANPLPLV